MMVDGSICSEYLVAVLGKDTNLFSGCQMWQSADQHRMVQVAWSAYQHNTWYV